MKVTFDNVYNAFQIIAPKGTMISFTGEPTALADGVYLVGDDGIINLDEQFLTDTLYLSTEGTDYAVTGGVRVIYPLGDETLIIRAGSSTIPFSKGGKGGGSGSGTTKYKGTTTTPISNGSTTNPIVIDGEDYTAVFGDIAVYNYTEFVFDGTQWSEFGRPFDTTPTSGSANAVTSDGIYALIRSGTGSQSVCIGNTGNTATGLGSTAMGIGSRAIARGAVAVGEYTNATGQSSFATGFYSATTNSNQFSCGIYNKSRTGDLFNIGNGKPNVRSNIVEVNSTELNVNGEIKKNGVSLPTPYTTMPTITAAMLGQIAMYVGETTNDYVKGYFYIASSDGAVEPTYSWVSMVDDVPTSGSKNFVSSDGIYMRTPLARAGLSNLSAVGGWTCSASGSSSFAYGRSASAAANYSVALGRGALTKMSNANDGLLAAGRWNNPRNGDSFNVGNGTAENARSNILEANDTSFNVNGTIQRDGVGIDDYTTTERKIGKWIDGSDLYQRTFEVTASRVDGWNDNILGTSGINIVDAQGFMYGSYEGEYTAKPLVYFRSITDYITLIYDYDVAVYIVDPVVSTSPMPTLTITIKYTKPSVQSNLMQTAPTEEVSETPTVEEDDMR